MCARDLSVLSHASQCPAFLSFFPCFIKDHTSLLGKIFQPLE